MKRIRLRGKLILGSLIMVVLVMLISAVIVSLVIGNQNRKISFTQLENALKIIEEDLNARRDKLMADAQQASTAGQVGSKIQFVNGYKEAGDSENITLTSYQEITGSLFQIAKTGNIRELSVFDSQGDLVAFSVKNGDVSTVGFATYYPNPLYHFEIIKGDEGVDLRNSEESAEPPVHTLKTHFEGTIPQQSFSQLEKLEQSLYLTGYVPVFGRVFNQKTDKLDSVQVGFVRCMIDLGDAFTSKMSALTGMKVNLFVGAKLSSGALKEYTELNTAKTGDSDISFEALQSRLSLNEINAQGEEYYQGVLPLMKGNGQIGAVAALYSKDVAKENAWQMIRLLGLVYLACILLSLPATLFFAGSLSKPISGIIERLRETAAAVFSMATQVTSASRELAEGASEQAASLEETSSSLEEFSAMTGQNAEHARKANEITKQGIQHLKEANSSMKALINSMEEISTASGNVAAIIKTIDQIAFQTNLLALNAAVEAARAGEAGAGFAVVAEEVRSLALRSAQASKNTQDLLQEIIGKIETGSTLVTETDDKYRNVALNIQEVTKLVEEISVASDEQDRGIQQVNTALGQIDRITQQNASGAEESASASQELNSQAEKMQGITDELANIVGRTEARAFWKRSHETTRSVVQSTLQKNGPSESFHDPQNVDQREWISLEDEPPASPEGK